MNFSKENFSYGGGYLSYFVNGEYKFIARLKYAQTSSKGPWITFMVKNFTVEEYFSRMENGEGPLTIMESKGFILSHIKKWLRDGGYPVTQEGYKQFMADDARKFKARCAA